MRKYSPKNTCEKCINNCGGYNTYPPIVQCSLNESYHRMPYKCNEYIENLSKKEDKIGRNRNL